MNDLKTQDATVSGEAQRIPANVAAQGATITAQIHVKRAATGLVEDYTLEFSALPEQPKEPTWP